ncbi:MAG: thiamine phosphate synthase [Acidobacteriaceae bacterium]
MLMNFPRLYPIIDADSLTARSIDLLEFAEGLHAAGVELLQYRNKQGSARKILEDAERLIALRGEKNLKLIMNDRADLALLSNFDGVHVGQEDLTVEDARRIVGPHAWVGVSTHTSEQVAEADRISCDYIAYGPVFPTASKNNPDPTVGLAGLRTARALTGKPLVAIGGITRENCRAVLDAGANSVAIISGLLPPREIPDHRAAVRRVAEEFLAILHACGAQEKRAPKLF